MGRNKKTGLDYFPFDIDFFQDIKVRKLIKHQGGAAVSVYSLLLCEIYKNGYYLHVDDDLPFLLSEVIGLKEEYIVAIIEFCLKVELFSREMYDKEHILTSRGIQERYVSISQRCRRKSDLGEFSLISSEEKQISSEETVLNTEESAQRKEKEKESKYKENNPPLTPPTGGASSDGGGKNFSYSFSEEKNTDVKERLRRNPEMEENYYYETMRLTSGMNKESPGYSVVLNWLVNPGDRKYYEIIQKLQRMEQRGEIRQVLSHDDYFDRLFIRLNCMKSDADAIENMIRSPALFQECKKLVKECRKGKINMPGKFILSGLRKCTSLESKPLI